jgi:hypothetical protein
VVLADDDVLLREGLAGLLERSGFEIVGQCGNPAELIALVREHSPARNWRWFETLDRIVRGGSVVDPRSSKSSSPPAALKTRSTQKETARWSRSRGGSTSRGHGDRSPTSSASVVVTLPANRKAVWRSDDSRSKGSRAETASRGMITSYQRSAALAAV